MAESDFEARVEGPGDAVPGRIPGDDFVCLRYRVWYPSIDCAIRTRFRTAPGCLNCDQGRFNLRRHAAALHGIRDPLASAESAR